MGKTFLGVTELKLQKYKELLVPVTHDLMHTQYLKPTMFSLQQPCAVFKYLSFQ